MDELPIPMKHTFTRFDSGSVSTDSRMSLMFENIAAIDDFYCDPPYLLYSSIFPSSNVIILQSVSKSRKDSYSKYFGSMCFQHKAQFTTLHK